MGMALGIIQSGGLQEEIFWDVVVQCRVSQHHTSMETAEEVGSRFCGSPRICAHFLCINCAPEVGIRHI